MGKKDSAAAENVKVLVRCRPLSEKERAGGHKSCVDLDLTAHTVTVNSVVGEPDRWTFDAVINNTFTQRDIFTQFILPLVDSVLEGYNATVFAYGQSGSGKTHTMTGVMGDDELEGVIPRCFAYIFDKIKEVRESGANKTYTMYVSFVELYNGKVRDLLAKQQVPLDVRENKDHTFFVQGAHIPQVKFVEDVVRRMEEGTERRRTAATELNADSSRSHSLFTLILECTETNDDGTAHSVTSKLNLVDLAGSERQSKTNATGDTLKEGCNINLSLSALGTVIDTIVKGAAHVPFRSSPLTMLLKDSLGGNSKTVMFANINPSERNLSETVSTLRFADRAKQIKNKPVVNMDAKDQKIAELAELVHELRGKLQRYETEGTDSLEREAAQLRETVAELTVRADRAEQAREADAAEFAAAQAAWAAEARAHETRLGEAHDALAQAQNNAQIAESSAQDALARLAEVMQLCATHLNEGKAIADTAALAALLSETAHGEQHALQVTQLESQLQAAQTQVAALRREVDASKAELQEQAQTHRSALAHVEAKVQLLKQMLRTRGVAAAAAAKTAATGAADGVGCSDDMTASLNASMLVASAVLGGAAAAAGAASADDGTDKTNTTAVAVANGKSSDVGVGKDAAAVAAATTTTTTDAATTTDATTTTVTTDAATTTATATTNAADGAAQPTSPSPETVDELREELASLKAELRDERSQCSELTESRAKLYAELHALRDELATVQQQATATAGEMQTMRVVYERKLAEASRSDAQLASIEGRLRERAAQVETMRGVLERQKELIHKSNAKADAQQARLRELEEKLQSTEQHYRALLHDKDESMQRFINERIAQYTTERAHDAELLSAAYKKLKKKLVKLKEQHTSLEEEYDKKVCECEELRNVLGERKLSEIRLQRRLDNKSVDIDVVEQTEQIHSALERAKVERKRRDDLFALGEVRSAKATISARTIQSGGSSSTDSSLQ